MGNNNSQKKTNQKLIHYGLLFLAAAVFWTADPSLFLEERQTSPVELAEQTIPVELVQVIDGDTVWIKKDGEEVKARLLLVDAPEVSATKTGQPQKFGKEAKDYLEAVLKGRKLSISFEETHTQEDQYGRLLVYLFAGNQLVQEWLLEEGYARLGYENKEETYYPLLQAAEAEAREEEKRIWGIPDYVHKYGFSTN